MDICVVGTGYVGLVVGTCMADQGFDVVCADKDEGKIAMLQHGEIPIYEPGLESIIGRNVRSGRLRFSTDGAAAIEAADVVYIAVGTPGAEDGSADLSGVLAVADLVGRHLRRRTAVIIKSTVPVGTADKVREAVGQHAAHEFDVVSNPEFLKEGAAISDFTKPDRIVVGCRADWAREVMETLYAGLVRTGKPILFMDNRSAELTKYAANAMLATKISFMNELARLCELVGADIEDVRRGTGSDSRIGPRFLFAGAGYGGSCFPKDVKALIQTATGAGMELRIAQAAEDVNASQKHFLAEKILARFGDDLSDRRFALWGLAFKPGTDDMREAPAVVIIERLLERGASVIAHDPEAMEVAHHILGDRIEYADSALAAVAGADALVLLTEWGIYRNPDLADLKANLASPIIFDGRNLYDPAQMREAGFEYHGIGRR